MHDRALRTAAPQLGERSPARRHPATFSASCADRRPSPPPEEDPKIERRRPECGPSTPESGAWGHGKSGPLGADHARRRPLSSMRRFHCSTVSAVNVSSSIHALRKRSPLSANPGQKPNRSM